MWFTYHIHIYLCNSATYSISSGFKPHVQLHFLQALASLSCNKNATLFQLQVKKEEETSKASQAYRPSPILFKLFLPYLYVLCELKVSVWWDFNLVSFHKNFHLLFNVTAYLLKTLEGDKILCLDVHNNPISLLPLFIMLTNFCGSIHFILICLDFP